MHHISNRACLLGQDLSGRRHFAVPLTITEGTGTGSASFGMCRSLQTCPNAAGWILALLSSLTFAAGHLRAASAEVGHGVARQMTPAQRCQLEATSSMDMDALQRVADITDLVTSSFQADGALAVRGYP